MSPPRCCCREAHTYKYLTDPTMSQECELQNDAADISSQIMKELISASDECYTHSYIVVHIQSRRARYS